MPSEGHPASPGNPFVPTATPVIPDHELLRLIGRGAYGEVWLARNAIGTLRAVKIVHRQSFGRAEHFEREFKGLLKFEPVSRTHEGLVHILQIGRRDEAGYFFYVMELADAAKPRGENGGLRMEDSDDNQPFPSHPPSSIFDPRHYTPHTLRSDLDKGSLPPAGCIAIGLKLASALEHLHANGLVHRDIKPSNIIFVKGAPKLADIGLVTAIDEAQSLVGTAGYIPPEGPGTAQADLYSLGKVLYEITFGKDRQEFPQLPPDLQSHPDYAVLLELNEIILKACETDPRERYASAAALREDLEMLQRGKSVKQKRTRQQRLALAKKVLVMAGVLGVLAASVAMLARGMAPANPYSDEPPSTNMEANKFCEKALLTIRGDNYAEYPEAYTNFHQSIKLDPQFVRPYAGLLELLLREGNPDVNSEPDELRKTATKLMQLAPHIAASYCARSILCYYDWNFLQATHYAFQATKANPGYELGHTWYGYVLTMTGWPVKAREQLETSRILAPSKSIIFGCLGLTYFAQRDFTNFFGWEREAIELGPHPTGGYRFMGQAFQAIGDYTNALDCLEKGDHWDGKDEAETKRHYGELRHALGYGGIAGYWQEEWKWTEINPDADYYWKAVIQIHLGNTNAALSWLNQSFKTREKNGSHGNLDQLLFDVYWDGMHDDPRFKELLDKIGFTKVMPFPKN